MRNSIRQAGLKPNLVLLETAISQHVHTEHTQMLTTVDIVNIFEAKFVGSCTANVVPYGSMREIYYQEYYYY